MNRSLAGIGQTALVVFCIVVLLGVLGVRIVDAGEVCAVTRLGQLMGQVGQGPRYALRGLYGFHCYSLRTQIYETSDQPEESQADYTDFTVDANTSDGQQVTITFGVGFHVDEDNVQWVYQNVGRSMRDVVERVVKFHSRAEVRKTAQEFTAQGLYSGDIRAYEAAIESILVDLFRENRVTLDTFTIRKITFDPDYMTAIEQQQIAHENIETQSFSADAAAYEADRTAALAEGEARAAVERARGNAEVIRITAEAEAQAIRVRGEALALYPQILQLEFINQLSSAQWLVLPEGTLPILPFSQMP